MAKKDQVSDRERRISDLKAEHYSDGHPLDEVQYLECKIILKPDRFTSRKSFRDFAALLLPVAKKFDIKLTHPEMADERPRIREVIFFDSKDYKLYNNAFILRRRIPFEDGFALRDPEIVFKFRHPDLQRAAEMDVRPNIAGDHRIKFKAEALPLKNEIGGFRLLYSHNARFSLSGVHEGNRTSRETLVEALPALAMVPLAPGEQLELVSGAFVEEVLLDIGTLDFGKGNTAKANVALWRERGEQRSLIGEFAFEVKFKRRSELDEKAMRRCEQFFCALQYEIREWITLGVTKTGVVYQLKGNPPSAHE
jgi:hypothetical protein